MLNKKSLWLVIPVLLLITTYIHLEILGPLLYDDNVVQDDFRQSFFWLWQFADPELLSKSYFKEMYVSNTIRTPLFYLIFIAWPFFTNDLILYSKLVTLITAIISSLTAFFFFDKLTNKRALAVIFAVVISVTFWCTDHISAVGQRSFIWLGLFIYMYFKQQGKNLSSSIVTFAMLLLSPISFLICLAMDGLNGIFKNGLKFFDFRKLEFDAFLFNTFSVAFLYFYLFKDLPTQGIGKAFSLAEMKALPEFNPGGRHPIFGSSIWDGSWWTNEHWGLGIGYLKISEIIIFALIITAFFVVTELLTREKNVKYSWKNILLSQPSVLFYASVILYLMAQVSFPRLYMPSRFIALPWLLLSVLVIFLILDFYCESLILALTKKHKENIAKFEKIKIIAFALAAVFFWQHYKAFYHPRYVSINPQVRAVIEALPKDAIIAGHPLLPDLNSTEILAKRVVFADYERSMAYTQQSLMEIRERNAVSLRMVFAKSREEFLSLAKANGITHFMAAYYFYTPQYLSNPVYMKPYDQLLIELVQIAPGQKFFLQQVLENRHSDYAIISVEEIK